VEGPESIYTLKQDQCVAHDTQAEVPGIELAKGAKKGVLPFYALVRQELEPRRHIVPFNLPKVSLIESTNQKAKFSSNDETITHA
jgi:hypothetical protein